MQMPRINLPLLISNVVLLLFVIAQLAFGQSQPANTVLRGGALELVDARGQVRCRINVERSGEVVLRLTDQRGAIRVKLGASADGSGLVLLDGSTEPGIQMNAKSSGSGITLTGAHGKQRRITP